MDTAILFRDGVGDLALEIELLLAADGELALQSMRRAGNRPRRITAREVQGRRDERLPTLGLLRSEHSRQLLVAHLRLARGTSGGIIRFRDHGEYRLADILHDPLGKDRVVVGDGAAVVLSRDVLRRQHRHHAWRVMHGGEVDGPDHRVRMRRQSQGGMQRTRQLRDVIDIGRLARHVQVCRFVRMRHMHGGLGCVTFR